MPRLTTLVIGLEAAWGVLRQNLVRSLLTLCLCGLGTAGVMVSGALSKGHLAEIDANLRALGGGLVIVSPNKVPPYPGRVRQIDHFISLTAEDAAALPREIPAIQSSVPVLARNTTVRLDRATSRVRLIGTAAEYVRLRGFTLSSGRFFGSLDEGDRVIVLGHAAWHELSSEGPRVGDTVMLGGQPYTVIGVLAPQGVNFAGEDEDHQVFIPLTTYQHRIANRDWLHFLYLRLVPDADAPRTVTAIQAALRSHHGRFRHQVDDVVVRDLADIAQQQSSLQAAALWAVSITTGLLLLMGTVGIATLMLLVVRQRRAEIGLRRALGATPTDIAAQFFVEGLVLTLAGVTLGVLFGLLTTLLLPFVTGTAVEFDPRLAIIAATVSLLTSSLACLWPALRAARLEPAAALRA